MARRTSFMVGTAVSLSALDLFANAVGALAFLLLLFAVNTIELVKQSTLTILTRRLPVSAAGADYVADLAAQGGVPPYSWTVRSGSLPEGLRLDPQRGEIVGVAAVSGAGQTFPLDVVVEDARKHTASARMEIRVTAPRKRQDQQADPLVLLTHGRLPDATADKPYEMYLSARGGSGRYRWSSEGLPEGFSVGASTGRLIGTAKKPGQYNLTLRVEDEKEGGGDAGAAVSTATLEVRTAGAPEATTLAEPVQVEILTRKLPPAVRSEPYEVTLAGTGAAPLRWSASSLPAGLWLSGNGLLCGVPLAATEVKIMLRLTDARNIEAPPQSVFLVVKPQPLSTVDRLKQRGLWGWLGYVLLALANVAYLYLLRRRESQSVQSLLRQHNVNLIQKPDGTAALNGAKEDMEAFQRYYQEMHQRHVRYKRISYALLAVGLIAFTLWLLR